MLSMLKNIALATLAILTAFKLFSQCTQNSFSFNDTICSSDSFSINQSSALPNQSFSIDFNSSNNLQIAEINSYPGQDTSSQPYSFGLELVRDEYGDWFGFSKSNNLSVTRFEFGDDLNNTPLIHELTINSSFSVSNSSISDLKIIKKNGQWLGISSFTASRLVIWSFGNSLTNDTVNAAVYYVGNTATSGIRDLDVFIKNDSLHVVTVGSEGRIAFFNMGPSGNNIYSDTSYLLTNGLDVSNARCVKIFNHCGNLHVFLSGITRRKLIHYIFAGSIYSAPSMTIDASSLIAPYSMDCSFEGGKFQLWIKNQTSGFTQYNYNSSITTLESTSVFQSSITDLTGYSMDIEKINDTINIFTATNQPIQLRRIQLTDSSTSAFGNFNASGTASYLYGDPGSYNIVINLIDSNFVISFIPIEIEIIESPNAQFASSYACLGDSIYFSDSTTSTFPFTINWSFGDGNFSAESNPVHLYSDSIQYNVNQYVTSSLGCVDSFSSTISVYGIPVPSFNFSNLCQGQNTEFTETTYYPTSTYSDSTFWIFNGIDTLFGTTASYVFPDTGAQIVELISVSNKGCSASFIDTIFINPSPIADFEATETCQGDTVKFENLTFSYNAFSTNWDFGDGTTSTTFSPDHYYADTGNYIVFLKTIGSGSCSDSTSETIRISEKLNLSITLPTDNICLNESNLFQNSSNLNNETISNSFWLMNGDYIAGTNITYIASEPDTNLSITHQLKLGTSCIIDTNFEIRVIPNFNLEILISGYCEATDNIFKAQFATINNQSATNYLWTLDNQSVSSDSFTIQNFTDTGNYNLLLKVSSDSGCTNSISKTVKIVKSPSISFQLEEPFCERQEIAKTFSAKASNSDTISNFSWILNTSTGADTIGEFDPIIFNSQQNNAVVSGLLTTTRGCVKQTNTTINVGHSPEPSLTWDTTCLGNAFRIKDLYDGNNYAWNWIVDSNISYSQNDPELYFTSSGIHHIQYHIQNKNTNCSADTAITIVISELTIDSFNTSTICRDQSAKIGLATTIKHDKINSILWEINNEFQLNDSAVIKPTSSEKTLIKTFVESSHGCEAIFIDELSLFPYEERSIVSSYLDSSNQTIALDLDNTKNVISTTWTFKDSVVSTKTIDTIQFSIQEYGNLNALIISTDGCISNHSKILYIGKPELNTTISNLEFDDEENKRSFNCLIQNNTNLFINSINVRLSSSNGSIWEENTNLELQPFQAKRIYLNTELINETSTYYCAQITEINTVTSSSNKTCTQADELQLNIVPNPFKEDFQLWMTTPESVSVIIKIYGLDGKLIFESEHENLLIKTQNKISINPNKLTSGLYILEILDQSNNKRYVRKLVKH